MSDSTSPTLIDPTFLFRFEIELKQRQPRWTAAGLKLPADFAVPSFGDLAGRPGFADVRIAWSPKGLAVHIGVTGKRQMPWCRDSRPEDSDGFHLWVDTRCSPGIHRATQFCHRFMFMPAGAGSRRDQPLATMVPIARARAEPKPVPAGTIKVAALPKHDGYTLSGFIPSAALTGYDPAGQNRIGFYYAMIDRELGWQTFSLGPEYPVMDDPSLWGEAALV